MTTTAGTEATVEIVGGEVDCTFAQDLLDTYYNDPPTPPEGSGARVQIGDWDCMTAPLTAGGDTTCESVDGGEIIASEVE